MHFDRLTQAQVRLAFQRFFKLLAPPVRDGLRTLTPADFALRRRRAAVVDVVEAGALVRLLAAECEARIGGRLRLRLSRVVGLSGPQVVYPG